MAISSSPAAPAAPEHLLEEDGPEALGLALVELLRQQHDEVLRRLDFQDDLLRAAPLPKPRIKQPQEAPQAVLESQPEKDSATEGVDSQGVDSQGFKPRRVSLNSAGSALSTFTSQEQKQRRTANNEHMKRSLSVAPTRKPPNPKEWIWRRKLQHIVRHPIFESFFAVVVITNAAYIGVDVQRSIENYDTRPVELRVIQYIYAAMFTFELLLRVLADGCGFFLSDDWAWSFLDLIIVIGSLWDVLVDVMREQQGDESELESIAGVSGLKSFRIVRLSRILKTAQFIRIFQFVIALRTLVTSILSTLKALMWALILLILIVYVFAVLFTQTVNEYLRGLSDPSTSLSAMELDASDRYFGSLWRSMLTLFMSVSGGVSWEDTLLPLEKISSFWVLCYIFYISFTYFAVLNVVTAVFCQSAIESAQNDQVTLMQSMLLNKERHCAKIQELFGRLGADDDGLITLAMFEEHINSETVRTYFESLGLDVWDAWSFFKLLDSDGGGSVDVEEFFMGCLRFRGQAKAMDVGQLIQDQSWLIKHQGKFTTYVEAEMKSLKRSLSHLTQLCAPLPKRSEWSPRQWKEK
mmetsp:Transcript_23564/g.54738  ORF Transcript_23564/g.54738 Transcript_23564/m.54738 type:complete len:579 (-) Transcript_23564:257-1993(-)